MVFSKSRDLHALTLSAELSGKTSVSASYTALRYCAADVIFTPVVEANDKEKAVAAHVGRQRLADAATATAAAIGSQAQSD